MKDGLELLDPVSELYVIGSYGDHRNVMVAMALLSGPLDLEAMKLAVDAALEAFPKVKSCVKRVWHAGGFQLAWEERAHVRPRLQFSRIDDQSTSESSFDCVLSHLRPQLDKHANLFQAAASQFYLVELPGGDHVLAVVIHHAAASGPTFAQVGGYVLNTYHKIVSGDPSEWTGLGLSTAKATRERNHRGIKGRRLFSLANFTRPSSHASGVIPTPSGHLWQDANLIKTVLPEEQTRRVVNGYPGHGIHLVDLLVACSYLTLVNWNGTYKAPGERFVISTTINMRNRFAGGNTPNFWSALRFVFDPSDGADPRALVRYVQTERRRQLTNSMDFRMFEDVCAKIKAARVVPFAVKQYLLRFYHLRSRGIPLLINYLGIIWPETRNGTPTGNSCLVRVGDAEVKEIDAFAYKTFSPIQAQLWVYVFRGRLNVVMASSDGCLTEAESRSFMNYLIDSLLASRTWCQTPG